MFFDARSAKTLKQGEHIVVQGCPGLRLEATRSEEHTSELQSQSNIVCRLLLEKKNKPDARPSRPTMRCTTFYMPLTTSVTNSSYSCHSQTSIRYLNTCNCAEA